MRQLIVSLFFFQTILSSAMAYELVVIQGISKERQTFITRNNNSGDESEVFVGKRVTFTSENTSVIAKAREVTREFIQWDIENDFTETPFQRGSLVTMYDATEYLWTLTPEKIKRKFIRNRVFVPRRSLEYGFSLSSGLSESVTETLPDNSDRGGYHFDLVFRKQYSLNWAMAYGIRYDYEIVNLTNSSLTNQRFMGTLEARYYFDPMFDFYNAQIGLGLGMGYGQSRTETPGLATFGNAFLLPSTRLAITFPIDRKSDVEFSGSFESFRLDEEQVDGSDQTTNLDSTRVTVFYRVYLDD